MSTTMPSPPSDPIAVDVIVPVYRDLDVTRTAIESVLAAPTRVPYELVVIDDASPEPALSAWLDTLAAAGRVTLLRNEVNLGFVRTANRGMRLHPGRDVVLLNSDAEVHGDWLDRLRAAALSGPRVASATPLTNSGWICSYPTFPWPSPLPAHATPASLAALAARHNDGVRVPQPIGIGFCLYLRRACLDEVGLFDEVAFGRGYGEESDLCLRAGARGWTHLLAADVFVHHIGAVSFTDAGRVAQVRANGGINVRRHPHYRAALRRHLRHDPARPYRLALDLGRLAAWPTPRAIVPAAAGAPPPSVPGHETLLLYIGAREVELVWPREGERLRLHLDLDRRLQGPDRPLLARVVHTIGARLDGVAPDPTPLTHAELARLAWPVRTRGPAAALVAATRDRVLALVDGPLNRLARRLPGPLKRAIRRLIEAP